VLRARQESGEVGGHQMPVVETGCATQAKRIKASARWRIHAASNGKTS